MITRDELIELGRYGKPHGVNGEISATLDCENELLSQFSCLVSEVDGIFVPFFVESIRNNSHATSLLKMEGVDDEHAVSLLVNKSIYVPKEEFEQLSQADEADAFPLDYFIGFVLKDGSEVVGEIVDVNDVTDNVLFVVERSDGTILQVPAVDELVVDVDDDDKTIVMDLPDGLLSL